MLLCQESLPTLRLGRAFNGSTVRKYKPMYVIAMKAYGAAYNVIILRRQSFDESMLSGTRSWDGLIRKLIGGPHIKATISMSVGVAQPNSFGFSIVKKEASYEHQFMKIVQVHKCIRTTPDCGESRRTRMESISFLPKNLYNPVDMAPSRPATCAPGA
jgi:hypothetical protein